LIRQWTNPKPFALRVIVIGGDRLANDYEAISRGQPIVWIKKATGRCPKAATEKQ